jgi:hypothetical protein
MPLCRTQSRRSRDAPTLETGTNNALGTQRTAFSIHFIAIELLTLYRSSYLNTTSPWVSAKSIASEQSQKLELVKYLLNGGR